MFSYPYDISCIRWSGHGDNAEPDPEISEFVRSWNEKYEWPRFSIASVSTAFSAFEKRYGNQLPQYRGDLTPYWEDGAGSSAFETGLNRGAADRLSAALALSRDQVFDLCSRGVSTRPGAMFCSIPNTHGAHGAAYPIPKTSLRRSSGR